MVLLLCKIKERQQFLILQCHYSDTVFPHVFIKLIFNSMQTHFGIAVLHQHRNIKHKFALYRFIFILHYSRQSILNVTNTLTCYVKVREILSRWDSSPHYHVMPFALEQHLNDLLDQAFSVQIHANSMCGVCGWEPKTCLNCLTPLPHPHSDVVDIHSQPFYPEHPLSPLSSSIVLHFSASYI